MKLTWFSYTGLLVLCSLVVISHTARRYERRPGPGQYTGNNQNVGRRVNPNNAGTPTGTPVGSADTGNSGTTNSMNVGDLSNAILGAVRPTIDSLTTSFTGRSGRPINRGRPTNRNNNGNNRFSRPEPQEVNYTLSEIATRFPWITNPSAIPGANNFTNDRFPHGSYRPADGWTRFNNPRYLRDRFEGLNLDNYGFNPRQGIRAANGKYKVRFSQDWRELPVYGFDIVLEQEDDTNLILESADGEFLSGIEDDISSEIPTIGKEDAIRRAIEHNLDQGKSLENPSAELIVDTVGDTAILAYLINYFVPAENQAPLDPVTPPLATTTTPPTTTAPIRFTRYRWRNCSRGSRGARRRCRRKRARSGVVVDAPTTPRPRTVPATEPMADQLLPESFKMANEGAKRPWFLMNANTGKIYKEWDGLTGYIRPGRVNILTGNPAYEVKEYQSFMYKDTDTDSCYYQRPLGLGKFLRVNDQSTRNTATVYRFKCSDGTNASYDATNGAASTRNSAFKWGYEALNFLRRTSNTVWNFDLNIETHHDGFLAIWNGRSVQLGDGTKRVFFPLTTPDTVTHEVAHAFTEHNSKLQYMSQSGAINEAYSDMAAVAFMDHFFNYNASFVYQIGRTALKYRTAIRDICNPRNTRLLLYRPTTPILTSANDYTPSVDLHNASALYSKAFCDLSKTPGWNIQQAFKVFTTANVIYWGPKETFHSGACGVKKAALDLKNTNAAVNDVDRAFRNVDIACDQANWQNL